MMYLEYLPIGFYLSFSFHIDSVATILNVFASIQWEFQKNQWRLTPNKMLERIIRERITKLLLFRENNNNSSPEVFQNVPILDTSNQTW